MEQVQSLKDKKVAILATHGFEEVELTAPLEELKSNGAEVYIVSDHQKIKSMHHKQWHREFDVDVLIADTSADDYDALVLPGGTINPDCLRRNEKAVDFVKQIHKQKKPIAAICHGPQMLIEAGIVKSKQITSVSSIKTDLKNAGAEWVDEPVVEDEHIISSRTPEDIPSFMKKINGVLKTQ